PSPGNSAVPPAYYAQSGKTARSFACILPPRAEESAMTDPTPWDIISNRSLTDEDALVRRLLDQAALAPEDRAAITAAGADLVRRIRGATRPGLMEVFLAEYGLSTDEGIALM